MRRQKWLAILIGLILMVGLLFPAQAEEKLPAEIQGVLAGAEILKTAYWESPGSTWFVLIRMPDGMNVLLCFELHDGNWIQSFHTSAAVPQGNARVVRLHLTDTVRDYVYNRTWPGPILMILTDDGGYTSYQRSGSGLWELFKVFCPDEQVHLDFNNESVIFCSPIDQDHNRFETVYGSFERDLRKVELTSIPKSPQQAQEMLNEAQSQSENGNQP